VAGEISAEELRVKACLLAERDELLRTPAAGDRTVLAVGGQLKDVFDCHLPVSAFEQHHDVGRVQVQPDAVVVVDHHPGLPVRLQDAM
jgi:hypothetical protein